MGKKLLVPKKKLKSCGKGKTSRCSKVKFTKLIVNVDIIAKGLKGGGQDDYYKGISELFSNENNNIKRLKEDLVNDILGTMTGGLYDLVNSVDNGTTDVAKRSKLLIFISSIINDIDKLEQYHISNIINSDELKELPYIDKVSTLVTINIFKKVYNSKYKDQQINETPFNFLANTLALINKIVTHYEGVIVKDVLKDLTDEVKRELMYYNHIYILDDYVNDNNKTVITKQEVEKVKIWLNDKVKEIWENHNIFLKLLSNDFLKNHTTGCAYNAKAGDNDVYVNKVYITSLKKLNDVINELKRKIGVLNNSLTKPHIYSDIIDNNLDNIIKKNIFPQKLHELYNHITRDENIIGELKILKENYKNCVKVFYDDSIPRYISKDTLTSKKKQEYLNASIKLNVIADLESSITLYNKTYQEINEEFKKWENIEKDINNYIPVDLTNIVFLYNKLCNSNYIYESNYNKIKKIIKDADETLVLEREGERRKERESVEEKIKNIEAVQSQITKNIGDLTLNMSDTGKTPSFIERGRKNLEKEREKERELEKQKNDLDFEIVMNNYRYNDAKDKAEKVVNNKAFDVFHYDKTPANEFGGGKRTAKYKPYISTGNFVYILYEKKKIRRCVYAKAKGRGKYCKIKGEYILLSKLKVYNP